MPLMRGGVDVYKKNRIVSDFLRCEFFSGGDTKRFSDGEILERIDKMSFIELILTVGYVAKEVEVGVDDRLFSLCHEAAERYLTLYKHRKNHPGFSSSRPAFHPDKKHRLLHTNGNAYDTP